MNRCQALGSPFDLDLINQIFDCALEWMHGPSIAWAASLKVVIEKRKRRYGINFPKYAIIFKRRKIG